MKRNMDLSKETDGRLYGLNDMVRCSTGGCKGCTECCSTMADTIVLDPYDVYTLGKALQLKPAEMLNRAFELKVQEGMIFPFIKASESGKCLFLNGEGRCSIHSVRPGFCRIFPLGRLYENGDFSYIFQINECPKPGKTKVKVKDWIDIENHDIYRRYINDWHYLIKELTHKMSELDENMGKNLNIFVLNTFYLTEYTGEDFFKEFAVRLDTFKEKLGL